MSPLRRGRPCAFRHPLGMVLRLARRILSDLPRHSLRLDAPRFTFPSRLDVPGLPSRRFSSRQPLLGSTSNAGSACYNSTSSPVSAQPEFPRDSRGFFSGRCKCTAESGFRTRRSIRTLQFLHHQSQWPRFARPAR